MQTLRGRIGIKPDLFFSGILRHRHNVETSAAHRRCAVGEFHTVGKVAVVGHHQIGFAILWHRKVKSALRQAVKPVQCAVLPGKLLRRHHVDVHASMAAGTLVKGGTLSVNRVLTIGDIPHIQVQTQTLVGIETLLLRNNIVALRLPRKLVFDLIAFACSSVVLDQDIDLSGLLRKTPVLGMCYLHVIFVSAADLCVNLSIGIRPQISGGHDIG